jgi:aryl-alcohol dehydrogenase-like predicted oxidoreductase
MQRVALGTAQFGMNYGVSNASGKVDRTEVASILVSARANGIDTLDTAIVYGDAEERIGQLGIADWRVVSKLPPLPPEQAGIETWVEQQVTGSLQRLRIQRLYGLLLHRASDLLSAQGRRLHAALESARDRGLVEHIGVSIYDPSILEAIAGSFSIGIVQAPLNVLDRRLVSSGWLDRLSKMGIEVHARSAFLQGLLLMNSSTRPPYFDRGETVLGEWERFLVESSQQATSVCLDFVLSHAAIKRVVVGVESLRQLSELIQPRPAAPPPPASMASSDPHLIDPSLWKLA